MPRQYVPDFHVLGELLICSSSSRSRVKRRQRAAFAMARTTHPLKKAKNSRFIFRRPGDSRKGRLRVCQTESHHDIETCKTNLADCRLRDFVAIVGRKNVGKIHADEPPIKKSPASKKPAAIALPIYTDDNRPIRFRRGMWAGPEGFQIEHRNVSERRLGQNVTEARAALMMPSFLLRHVLYRCRSYRDTATANTFVILVITKSTKIKAGGRRFAGIYRPE